MHINTTLRRYVLLFSLLSIPIIPIISPHTLCLPFSLFLALNMPRGRPRSTPPLRRCSKNHMAPKTEFRQRPNGSFYSTCKRCLEAARNRPILGDLNPNLRSTRNGAHSRDAPTNQRRLYKRRATRPTAPATPLTNTIPPTIVFVQSIGNNANNSAQGSTDAA